MFISTKSSFYLTRLSICALVCSANPSESNLQKSTSTMPTTLCVLLPFAMLSKAQ